MLVSINEFQARPLECRQFTSRINLYQNEGFLLILCETFLRFNFRGLSLIRKNMLPKTKHPSKWSVVKIHYLVSFVKVENPHGKNYRLNFLSFAFRFTRDILFQIRRKKRENIFSWGSRISSDSGFRKRD